jgi:hypothetical protein
MEKIEKKKRKGQEESMGFVVIVLLLVVVAVVFLGFSLKKSSSSVQNQQELADLTWSVLSYTTNCTILGEKQSVWDLSRKCRTSSPSCESVNGPGMDACTNLNATIQDIFLKIKGTNVSLGDKSIHAYDFTISTGNKKIFARQGNFSGDFVSYSTFIPTNINVTAKFYYS